MESIINFLQAFYSGPWYEVAIKVIGTAAAIAAITPNKVDNQIVDALLKAINALGANFGKAKNDPNA